MMIKIKSPTRVDLAGGTLDMWPLHTFVGEALTINVAIDIYTEVDLVPKSESKKIRILSPDLNFEYDFDDLEEFLRDPRPQLKYYQMLVGFFKPPHGFHLETRSMSPVGGGLGGSSSLLISMLKAFSLMSKRKLGSVLDIVQLSHNLEASLLRTPTGTQDYIPAITGGLNFIEYGMSGIEIITEDPAPFWEDHFLLVHTGRSHHSGLNNFEVLKSAVSGDPQVLGALHEISFISRELQKALNSKSWDRLPLLFAREYKARIQLTEAFSSPEIRRLQDLALSFGLPGVKICGAGGGGCVLIWCESKNQKKKIEDQCRQEGFHPLRAKPVRKQNLESSLPEL
jgi:D-glycero-alpha-D-manno-heptose-7-phosphate kinase